MRGAAPRFLGTALSNGSVGGVEDQVAGPAASRGKRRGLPDATSSFMSLPSRGKPATAHRRSWRAESGYARGLDLEEPRGDRTADPIGDLVRLIGRGLRGAGYRETLRRRNRAGTVVVAQTEAGRPPRMPRHGRRPPARLPVRLLLMSSEEGHRVGHDQREAGTLEALCASLAHFFASRRRSASRFVEAGLGIDFAPKPAAAGIAMRTVDQEQRGRRRRGSATGSCSQNAATAQTEGSRRMKSVERPLERGKHSCFTPVNGQGARSVTMVSRMTWVSGGPAVRRRRRGTEGGPTEGGRREIRAVSRRIRSASRPTHVARVAERVVRDVEALECTQE